MKVAEYGTLTKAATALGISQPALSSGLNSLEKELGIRIFNRRSVPVSLTSEGLVYYDYIRRLQILSDDFSSRITALREDADKRVVIGGPSVYVETIVTDAVIRLKQINPDFRIQIKTAPLEELIGMAAEGKIHCFISTSDRLPDGFEKIRIKDEQVYLVIPEDNPINAGLADYRVSPGETGRCFDYSVLNGRQFIFLEENKPLQNKVNTFLRKNRIEPMNRITVDQGSTAVNLALKGAGICFASEESLEGNIRLDGVCVYPLPPEVSGRSIFVAYDRELYRTEACKQLIQLLVTDKDHPSV